MMEDGFERREFLLALTGVGAAGVAGCAGVSDSERGAPAEGGTLTGTTSETATVTITEAVTTTDGSAVDTPTDDGPGPADRRDRTPTPTVGVPEYSNGVDEPASATVRNPEAEPAVRSSARSPGEDLFESSAAWEYEDWLVTAPEERDALEFASATAGIETATEFASAIDFSGETLLVHQYDVSACATRRLMGIEWREDAECGSIECVEIRLTYRETERDDCSGSEDQTGPPYDGDYVSEATFVRIPDRIRSYGAFGAMVR